MAYRSRSRRSTARRSTRRTSARRSARPARSKRGLRRTARGAPQTLRIVVETAGSTGRPDVATGEKTKGRAAF